MSTTTDQKSPKGFIGNNPDDTISNVSDVLSVLTYFNYQDSEVSESAACGLSVILYCAMEAVVTTNPIRSGWRVLTSPLPVINREKREVIG